MRNKNAERVAYGDESSQRVEVWAAPSASTVTVVLIHGGFWRANYDLGLMDALCADIVGRGWRAVNVEYRREAGWPAMADDIRSAWATVVALAGDDTVVTMGHSAGGHLALWMAATCNPKPAIAVSLAGVVDLVLAQQLGLGGGAVDALLGSEPLGPADPAQLVPLGVPTLLVAPLRDTNVPCEVSVSYADKAKSAGDAANLIEPPGDHMAVIDPGSDAWAQTWAAIDAQLGGLDSPLRHS